MLPESDESDTDEDDMMGEEGEQEPEERGRTLDKESNDALKGKIQDMLQEKGEDHESEGRGVIYLGHIPFGFFEEQMRGFFGQFGVVTRLRLARSKKTGGSKGYAYIEFSNTCGRGCSANNGQVPFLWAYSDLPSGATGRVTRSCF